MKHFIYKTTNRVNGKTYIGLHSTDNLDDGYLGSGVAFKSALKKYGKENFKREILQLYNSLDELIKAEEEIVTEEWVAGRDNYNLKTGGLSGGKLSNESKEKISKTLKKKYETGELKPNTNKPYDITDKHKEKISKSLKKRYELVEHHLKNTEPWNKGKTGVQEAWNKGKELPNISDEHKEKISKTLKERYKNVKHNRVGVEPWNKGKKGLQEAWNKGNKMEVIECPHCGKIVDKGNGKRWHFDNCKNKPKT